MQRYLKIFVLMWAVAAQAQHPVHMQVKVAGPHAGFIRKNITYPATVNDSMQIARELGEILLQCNRLSFLNAAFTEVRVSNDTCSAVLLPGKSYKWVRLKRGNVSDDILGAAGFREEQFHNKVFDPVQFATRAEKIVATLESHGYPFASISLDSIEADSIGISATMNLDRDRLVIFDTIEMRGKANARRWYLEKYLGIKQGAPYNEGIMKEADSRLSQLGFLKTTRASAVYFFADKARPVLFLEDRKASSVDGIIGFAPKSAVNNSLKVTGEANLKLQNILGSGKNVELNYRSFLESSQDLKVKFQWPYIFRSSVGLGYQLSLLKYDELFLDVINEFALQYSFIGTDYLKVFYSIQTTALITVDTVLIKATRALPDRADIRYDQYGIGVKKSKYDYFLNPRKGYGVELSLGAGNKRIVENSTIRNLRIIDDAGQPFMLYDRIQKNYTQYRLNLTADGFVPLAGRVVSRLQLSGGHIGSQQIFFNELYRIGGIKTLKGFDEQSLFASSFLIINTELRYLLQQNSNIILFWNGAWYRNTVRTPHLYDTPYGFGAGMNFESGAGVFSVFYALGKQLGNSIEFDKARIHFGFVNYF